jgi:ABC-type glutathione transport system ATPase component
MLSTESLVTEGDDVFGASGNCAARVARFNHSDRLILEEMQHGPIHWRLPVRQFPVTGQRQDCYLASPDPGEYCQNLAEPVLELRSISKSFGAIRALSDVDLSLEPGEVLGLMGDNGAGKSTLVRIMAGNFAPTTGGMRLN